MDRLLRRLVLAVAIPLLAYVCITRLVGERLPLGIKKYREWAGTDSAAALEPLLAHARQQGVPPRPDDLVLPVPPADSGVKSWLLRPNRILLVTVNAKVDGREVLLFYVPLVRDDAHIVYECLSVTPASYVGSFCRGGVKSMREEVGRRLDALSQALPKLPRIVDAGEF